MKSSNNELLESVLMRIVQEQNALGALMLMIHRGDRAEVVAAFTETVDDLAGKLQRLADRVKDGDGMALGRDSQKITPEEAPFTIGLNPVVKQLLAVLCGGDARATILKLIDHAQQGVYRPGSWERAWLTQAFGDAWLEDLIPGDPYGHHANEAIFRKPKS